jgi:hypothetical protein
MDFLDQTIEVWQRYSDRPLTREDAREIAHNVTGFFRTLREWAEEERAGASFQESAPAAASMKAVARFQGCKRLRRRRLTGRNKI